MRKFLFLVFAFLIFPFFVLATDKVEINTASLEQLDKITGIGPVLGQRIIDGRPFSSVDDLLRVSGIGPKTLQKIKDQGLAYVEGQTQQPAQEVNQTQSPAPAPSTTLTPTITPAETSATPNPTPASIIQAVPEIKNYPLGIIFSEILPSPEGPDETEEWIEIQNQNNFEVELSGWQIKDTEGKTSTYVFPNETRIVALGYLVLPRTETKIILNNDGDGLNIINPNKESIDSVSFEKAPLGQSYAKVKNTWLWNSILTPGKENIAIVPQKENYQNKKSPEEPASPESPLAKETAAIGKAVSVQKDNKLFFVFSIAFIVSVFSVIAVFLIKKLSSKNPPDPFLKN